MLLKNDSKKNTECLKSTKNLLKQEFYRYSIFDLINLFLKEVKSMNRARKVGVLTPAIYLVDLQERKIIMEYLGGHAMTVKDFIK